MDKKELRKTAEAIGMAVLFGGAVAFVKVTEPKDSSKAKTTSLDIVVGQDSPFTARLSGVVNKVETPKWRECRSGSRQACTSSATLKFEWPRARAEESDPSPSPATNATGSSDDVII